MSASLKESEPTRAQPETMRARTVRPDQSLLAPRHPAIRIARVQRSLGNQGAQRFLQAKMRVSQPNDPLEREANQVADAVVSGAAVPGLAARSSPATGLHRSCDCGGTCPKCADEDEETLQRKSVQAGHSSGTRSVPAVVHDVLRSGGQPLDLATRASMEPRFGRDFGDVRVHTGRKADESAKAVNAHAYTVGPQIVFGEGKFAPSSPEGRRLMAHELAHVVQQSPSRTAPNVLHRSPADLSETERNFGAGNSAAELKPFREAIGRAESELREALRKPESDDVIAYERATVRIMRNDYKSYGTSILLVYSREKGGADRWERDARERAQSEVLGPEPDFAAFGVRMGEYAEVAGMLRSGQSRSARSLSIPKKGLSYLITDSDALQLARNRIADGLGSWVGKHMRDPNFTTHDVAWGLEQLFTERPQLVADYRAAQLLPAYSEEFHDKINVPLFVTVTEIAVSFIPLVGTAVKGWEVYSGEDLFGYEMSPVDRAVNAVFILIPFVSKFFKAGKALYTADEMARLYGDDAQEWARLFAMGEKLEAHPQGKALLAAAARRIQAGETLANDAAQVKQLETLFQDLTLAGPIAASSRRAELAASISQRAESTQYPILQQLSLDSAAIDRVIAKGPELSHIKGQLLEELLAIKVGNMLESKAGREALGVGAETPLKFIPGNLIRDEGNAQITDGLIGIENGDTLEVVVVFESKAGKEAAKELSRKPAYLTQKGMIEFRKAVKDRWRDLKEEAERSGKPFTTTLEDLEKTYSHRELGGQVRTDMERLDANFGKEPTSLVIDGVKTKVVVRPSSTKFIGVVPADVSGKAISKELKRLGYNFEIMGLEIREEDLKAISGEFAQVDPARSAAVASAPPVSAIAKAGTAAVQPAMVQGGKPTKKSAKDLALEFIAENSVKGGKKLAKKFVKSEIKDFGNEVYDEREKKKREEEAREKRAKRQTPPSQ